MVFQGFRNLIISSVHYRSKVELTMKVQLKTPSLFELLLQKVAKEGKSEFKIDRYTFFFRYSTVKIGTTLREEIQIPKLDANISDEDVESLVFDVTGLDDSYITQIEVTRNELYVIPSRSLEKIQSFQSLCE